jgi:serine/threonine protein kinase
MTPGAERLCIDERDTRVGSMIGPYRIVREIGRGGMGVVYEAVHEAIGQRAAVKLVCDGGARNREGLRLRRPRGRHAVHPDGVRPR